MQVLSSDNHSARVHPNSVNLSCLDTEPRALLSVRRKSSPVDVPSCVADKWSTCIAKLAVRAYRPVKKLPARLWADQLEATPPVGQPSF